MKIIPQVRTWRCSDLPAISRRAVALKIVLAAMLAVIRPSFAAQQHSNLGGASAKLGSVHFETSCLPKAQVSFDRAMALLHSFEFGPAIDGFHAALAADPHCAIANWGVALSTWGNPFAPGLKPVAYLRDGRKAIEAAQAPKAGTQRERDYIAAAAHLYDKFQTTSQMSRVNAYCEEMSKVAARYPSDTEASIFYALSLAASADLSDKTYAKQLKAGAILENLFAKQPQHPGLAHYIIHSYDFPALAERALPAARAYAKIAPDAPHALHMPSHIFTRVGSWDESVAANLASAATSQREGNVTEELHASDYLMYAYLQSGRDKAAAGILHSLPEIESRFHPEVVPIGAAPTSAAYFALAAIPARYTLERSDWSSASRLEPRTTNYPHTDAITWFARGLGAAHMDQVGTAREASEQLASIHQRLIKGNEPYWALQVEIQRLNVLAWTALASKDAAGALEQMRKAVELEDGTEKSAVTPGPIAPAAELLGEMLLELNRPDDALRQFEAVLGKEPNRFRSLYGAARAAKLSGNPGVARRYAKALVKVCEQADRPGRSQLEEAIAISSARSTGQ